MSEDFPPRFVPEDDPLRQNPDFKQGHTSGWRYILDIVEQGRVALDPEGGAHDMVRLAAAGFLPDDVQTQIGERVPLEHRADFELGFVSACRDFLLKHDKRKRDRGDDR